MIKDPYGLIRSLLRDTRSGALIWSPYDDSAYGAVAADVHFKIYPFQQEVRGISRIVLQVSEGRTQMTIREPVLHISAVPLGKMIYFLVALWNYITPSSLRLHVSYYQETAKGREEERLRLAMRELYSVISEAHNG